MIVDTPTPISASPTPVRIDKAGFVTDITIRDGKRFNPGRNFTKTWRLANVGTTIWTSDYELVFDHGDQMGGPDVVPLPKDKIYPWQSIDVSIGLGTACQMNLAITVDTGSCKMQMEKSLALIPDGETAFWVDIVVIAGPTVTPNTTITVTPTVTTTGTATLVPEQIKLDFTNNFCAAQWVGNEGIVPCPGKATDTKGFITAGVYSKLARW